MNALGGDTIKSQARMVQRKLRNKHSEEGTGGEPTSPKPRDCDRSFLAGGCKTVGADSHGTSYTTVCVAFGRRSIANEMSKQRQTSQNQGVESQTNYKYSEEQLLEELRRAYKELGKPPTTRSDVVRFSEETYRVRFGSWIDALREAGIEPEKKQTKDESAVDRIEISELVDEILNKFAETAEIPYEEEIASEIDDTQATTDIAGSWSETLKMAGLPARKRGGFIDIDGGRVRDYGEGWERVRNDVLVRDRYRCQHCGEKQHILKERGESLHVHHIKPIKSFEQPETANFSENLITLCRPCHEEWESVTQLAFSSGSGVY